MTADFARFTEAAIALPPQIVLVLGSGMGGVTQRVDVLASVGYGEIEGLSAAGVHGHRGRLTLALWGGRVVLLCEGRLHFYEGHPWERVTALVRLAARLGARAAVLTNAAGGIHDELAPGSLMALRDHLDLTPPFWWRRPGPGSRPSPYTPRLIELAQEVSRSQGQPLLAGVYAMCAGPSYETPAEIRAIRGWGADAVGMSTGREAEAAATAGLECLGLSCITNRGAGLSNETLSHQEVMEVAGRAAQRMADLLETIVVRL